MANGRDDTKDYAGAMHHKSHSLYQIVSLVLLSLACGAPIESTHIPEWQGVPCYGPQCGFPFGRTMVYTPDPNALADTLETVRRLNAATGAEMSVGPNGVPITRTGQVYSSEGQPLLGYTSVVVRKADRKPVGIKSIDLTPLNDPDQDVANLIHEALHAMAPSAEHVPDSIFAKYDNGVDWIGEEVLVEVCGEFDCREFVPED